MPETSPLSPPARNFSHRAGFTLIELLVVVGVIVLMMGLAIPAFNAIRGGTDFNSVIYSITGALQEGRAYAMANDTYVLVGFSEVSAAQNGSATPQVSGTGRLAIAIIASRDGTRPYQPLVTNSLLSGSSYLTAAAPPGYGSGTQYTAVTKLIVLTNIHMVDLQSDTSQEPTAGGMLRPWHTSLGNGSGWTTWENYCLGDHDTCQSGNCFLWPLGTSSGGTPTPQYVFDQVIEFDPQGAARMLVSSPTGSTNPTIQEAIPYFIEIGIEPSNGVGAPSPSGLEQTANGVSPGQIAAIQVDGMTGAVRTYRP
jgi:prepilin-type N-terminal cleavage/methylation domain-containing protein